MGSCHSHRRGHFQCHHCRRWCALGTICECRRGHEIVIPPVIYTNPLHHHHHHGHHFGHHHHHHHHC